MKIGIANRDPNTYPGGDNVQINALAKALELRGVSCYQPLEFKPNWSEYDIVHAYHVNFSWSNIIYNNIWEQNKPYIITAIFYPSTDLGSNASQMRDYVNKSLFTVVQSNWEKQELLEIVQPEESKIRVIPNGVETEFIVNQFYGDRDGVITVSARDGDKNSFLVKTICKELDVPYTNVTGIPHNEMPDVYKKAKVFVNASDSERMSLTTHEALASYCKVVSTEFNRGNEWFPGLVTCNPNNPHDLKSKISFAYKEHDWCYIPNESATYLTWSLAADRYIQYFQEFDLYNVYGKSYNRNT